MAEAYSSLGLVDATKLTTDAKAVAAASATPRTLVARNKVQFRSEANAHFGSLIPIRLY